ncbi:MAG: transketolase [Spirochaetales bacterium]|nr:transketolase [Spirochaetales bacterium]
MGEKANLIDEKAGSQLFYIKLAEIQRICQADWNPVDRASILADINRLNALYMITLAGSGHIGTSFSSMDLITYLYTEELNLSIAADGKPQDLFFSSKGHDAPGLYSVLIGLGRLEFHLLHQLRKLNGLPGHPDVSVPGLVTNTGSLGMGISKAKGIIIAARLNGIPRRVFVMTGDGELQEGQIWESLQPVANAPYGEITMIVDHNKIQSDTWVKDVSDLGDLEAKFRAFGWEVARCDGHNLYDVKEVLDRFRSIPDRPKVLIADTIKGKGVSFMQTMVTSEDGTMYRFHSGAPAADHYADAFQELLQGINAKLGSAGLGDISISETEQPPKVIPSKPQKLIAAYGDELVQLAGERHDILALDADLILDTGLIPFSKRFPERFIESGIAEQDMVSTAGGLALMGKLPIVHSFACFLSTRPNEQIYNNSSEKTKIIYVGSLAGVLPAGPGHSHQSVRDISALGGIPGLTMIEPSCEREVRLALKWAVNKNQDSTYIRLVSIPVEVQFQLPDDYTLIEGRGVILHEGKDLIVFAYGPVLLAEAFVAAQMAARQGISVCLVNLPWLNQVDAEWLSVTVQKFSRIIFLDNHYRKGGQGEMLAAVMARTGSCKGQTIEHYGLDDIPVCGRNPEILEYYGLDRESLSQAFLNLS